MLVDHARSDTQPSPLHFHQLPRGPRLRVDSVGPGRPDADPAAAAAAARDPAGTLGLPSVAASSSLLGSATVGPRLRRSASHLRRMSEGAGPSLSPTSAFGLPPAGDDPSETHRRGRFTVIREQSSHWRPIQRRAASRFQVVDAAPAGDSTPGSPATLSLPALSPSTPSPAPSLLHFGSSAPASPSPLGAALRAPPPPHHALALLHAAMPPALSPATASAPASASLSPISLAPAFGSTPPASDYARPGALMLTSSLGPSDSPSSSRFMPIHQMFSPATPPQPSLPMPASLPTPPAAKAKRSVVRGRFRVDST